MTVKTKPQIIGYYRITLLALVFLFLSCKQSKDTTNLSTSASETDSISAWISIGRNNAKSLTTRKSNLIKAYTASIAESNDSTKLKYLSKIQWSFLGLNDSLWFRKTNKETTLLARKYGDSTRLAGSYWDLGVFHEQNNIVDSAYYNLLEAKKIYLSQGKFLNAGKLEIDIATLQANIKNYTSAEVAVIDAIELLKPLEEYEMLYKCYNLLGIISKDLGDYEQSLQYYDTAKFYLEKSGKNNVWQIQLENNMGTTYEKKGNYDKAVANYRKILQYDSLYQKNPATYARVLNNLATSLNKLNPSDASIEKLFLKSLNIRDSLGDTHAMAGGFFELSNYYLGKKDSTSALSSALKAKSYAELSNNNERLLETLAQLAKLDSKNATTYISRYIALGDSLQQEERKIRNKFARIRFETDEVVAQNEFLSRQRLVWAGIAGIVLLLGGATFIIFYQRAKNQKLRFEQEQQISNEEIFNLMISQGEKVEEAKKMEQKRVSEELHDGVLGKMLGARMMLLGLNKKTGPEAIGERAKAISILQDVEGEVRSISHELSHAAYQKIHNFILSIKDLVKTIESASKINIDFKFTDELDWDALSGEIKINLYRMVQESLQNSVKHAACKNIYMNFDADERLLTVAIRDDGRGFIRKKGKKGIGMRNMASRIKKINGTWDIRSQIGKGTTVTFIIPMVTNDYENTIRSSAVKLNLQETH